MTRLVGLLVSSAWDAYYIGLTSYALSTLLFSWLFYQSRCITRILAAWGVLASLFEGLCAFAYLNHREFGAVVSVNWYEMPTVFFELALCIWILATALRPPRAGRQTLRPFHGSRCRDRVRDS